VSGSYTLIEHDDARPQKPNLTPLPARLFFANRR